MKPLEGMTILAITQYGAGPYAMIHLADLGANVIKIEDPNTGGDVARTVIPYAEDGDSLYFQAFNRNKKSITLNLKTSKGKEIFHKLVEKSDAVFNNLRGDVPDKLGITYPHLKKYNPQIVTCSLTGFGTNSSMNKEPAYDYLLQAMMGHMSLTGDPNGPPEKFGLSILDFSTGMMAALGLMVGIYQAKIKGEGCDVDVSLFDTATSVLNYLATWHLNEGYEPQRTQYSAHPSQVPSQLFPTQDGHIMVMCNKEKFFTILCDVLGAPQLAEDERFKNFQGRLENKEQLIPELIALFQKQPTDYWLSKLKGLVPVARVNNFKEALEEPLVKERNMIVEAAHPRYGTLKLIGTPIKVSGFEPDYKAAPPLGAHTQEVFEELLGFTPEQIDALRAEQVI